MFKKKLKNGESIQLNFAQPTLKKSQFLILFAVANSLVYPVV